MRRRVFFQRSLGLALLLITSFLASALALETAAEAPTLEEVVRRVERRYNSARTLAADFVQRYTLGPTTLVESGRVYFEKPGRMRWEYNSPEEKLFLSDGKYVYFYVPQERQVRRTKLKESEYWQAAFALLLGRANLKRLFKRMELVTINRPEQNTRWQLRCTARSDRQGFDSIWFDLNERYQILRVEIRQRDGSLMEFHFRRWQENLSLESGLFLLQVPSGTVWINE